MTNPAPNPRRVQTVLLAIAVALLVSILIVLVVNSGDSNDAIGSLDDAPSSTDGSGLDESLDSPAQVVKHFMTWTMVERDPSTAEALMCDDYTGPTPAELLTSLTEWEQENDVLAEATVEVASSSRTTGLPVSVKLVTGASFFEWTYELDVKDENGWKVCSVDPQTA